jgi:sRNA-binding regulator protein Hfq
MEPHKKIRINKKVSSKKDKSKQDSLKIIENTLKKLENRYKQFGFNDSKEEDFFNENQGEEIVLQLKTQEVSGTLEFIDKYRIGINQDGKTVYYYKHAIISYYVK